MKESVKPFLLLMLPLATAFPRQKSDWEKSVQWQGLERVEAN